MHFYINLLAFLHIVYYFSIKTKSAYSFLHYIARYLNPSDIISRVLFRIIIFASSDVNLAFFMFIESLKYSTSDQSAGQGYLWEIVPASQILETYHSVHNQTIDEAYYGWQHLDL